MKFESAHDDDTDRWRFGNRGLIGTVKDKTKVGHYHIKGNDALGTHNLIFAPGGRITEDLEIDAQVSFRLYKGYAPQGGKCPWSLMAYDVEELNVE